MKKVYSFITLTMESLDFSFKAGWVVVENAKSQIWVKGSIFLRTVCIFAEKYYIHPICSNNFSKYEFCQVTSNSEN